MYARTMTAHPVLPDPAARRQALVVVRPPLHGDHGSHTTVGARSAVDVGHTAAPS